MGEAKFERREKAFNLRIDVELYEAAMKTAAPYGLSALIRALLKAHVNGEIQLKSDALPKEMTRAPRVPKQKRKKK